MRQHFTLGAAPAQIMGQHVLPRLYGFRRLWLTAVTLTANYFIQLFRHPSYSVQYCYSTAGRTQTWRGLDETLERSQCTVQVHVERRRFIHLQNVARTVIHTKRKVASGAVLSRGARGRTRCEKSAPSLPPPNGAN